MNLIKDEKVKLTIKDASIRYMRYLSYSSCQIELIAAPDECPIVLPNQKIFLPEWESTEGCDVTKGVINVVIKRKNTLGDVDLSGSLIVAPGDSIEVEINMEEIYFDNLLCSLNHGMLPRDLSFYVKDAKTENPLYKALKLIKDKYEINDWNISLSVKI